jgi:hypothetical protein
MLVGPGVMHAACGVNMIPAEMPRNPPGGSSNCLSLHATLDPSPLTLIPIYAQATPSPMLLLLSSRAPCGRDEPTSLDPVSGHGSADCESAALFSMSSLHIQSRLGRCLSTLTAIFTRSAFAERC